MFNLQYANAKIDLNNFIKYLLIWNIIYIHENLIVMLILLINIYSNRLEHYLRL